MKKKNSCQLKMISTFTCDAKKMNHPLSILCDNSCISVHFFYTFFFNFNQNIDRHIVNNTHYKTELV